MAKNLLEGNDYGSFSSSKSSAKIKAKFGIFLCRISDLEAEIEELLCLENNDSVQPATLKLRAIDLRDRLTSFGVTSWINRDLDQIDPIGLSDWEDKVSKDIARVLYEAEEKITFRKICKKGSSKFNESVLDFPLFK